ncbi:MAG: ABC transporter permease [Anaerolineae bacterium]|nr:ABC transporter permease [Anaerolineales bacterium]MCQ3976299.1 ABC transporter permease [Anaerolineae bacterium]
MDLSPQLALNSNTREEEEVFVASPRKLMWWKFRKHKMAVVAVIFLVVVYFCAIFSEFVAPYDPFAFSARYTYLPPQAIHLLDENGRLQFPFTYEINKQRDPETFALTYTEDTTKPKHYLRFFVTGAPYKLWGLIPSDIHLFGVDPAVDNGTLFLMGTDSMGRDVFSRVIFGARISMSVSLVGTFLSLVLGIFLGGLSGYFGGWIDMLVQRMIELFQSIPTLPLWMGLAAAIPLSWDPLTVYFLITIILSLISWTGMARVVRGRFLSMREEDFVMAAKLLGAGDLRIIINHMVPSFLSHIIAVTTLTIPELILSETALSFIGLGLRPPVVSWGVLLQDAQNVSSIALAPWLLLPALFLVLTIVAFNFFGDGLRDAADPYVR